MIRLPNQPQLRTAERGHRQAAWSELFYDLVFVVIISQFAHLLSTHLNWSGVLQFVLLFIPAWWAWVGEVYYSTRFDSDADKGKRFLGTVQLVALVGMAAAVGTGFPAGSWLYGAAYALVRTMQLAELWRAGYYLPEARPFTSYQLRGHGAGVLMWWLSLLLPEPLRYAAWALGLAVEVGSSLRAGDLHRRFPPHVSHLPERFGLLIILALGESFSGAARGLLEHHLEFRALALAALGVLLAVAVWWTYFDRLTDDAVKALANEGRSRPYLLWLYAHLPIALAVTALGVGIEQNLLGENGNAAWVLAGALAVYLAAEGVVCATAIGAGRPTLALTWGVRFRFAALPVALLLPLISHSPWWMLGSSALLLWLVVWGDRQMEGKPQDAA